MTHIRSKYPKQKTKSPPKHSPRKLLESFFKMTKLSKGTIVPLSPPPNTLLRRSYLYTEKMISSNGTEENTKKYNFLKCQQD